MDEGWSLDIVDLDLLPGEDGFKVQTELLSLTGQRTVPNIFIGGTPIGGNSELQSLHHETNELELMLESLVAAHGEDL